MICGARALFEEWWRGAIVKTYEVTCSRQGKHKGGHEAVHGMHLLKWQAGRRHRRDVDQLALPSIK